MNKQLTEKEKKLIKKIEENKKPKPFTERQEMYISQTDRNYKDGDRN